MKILKKILNLLEHLYKEKSGAAAIVFGLTLPIVVTAVGFSVDMSQAFVTRERLSRALDAAALAAAALASDDQTLVEDKVQDFLDANYPEGVIGTQVDMSVVINPDENTVSVVATGRVKTAFLGIIGHDYVNVTVDSTVKREGRSVEVAMVIDITGSMAGEKIADLKVAAHSLIDILIQEDQESEFYSKLAIVPYSNSVNVGAYAGQVRGTFTNGTCTTPGCQYYNFINATGGTRTFQISSCVSERAGVNAYTDVAPSSNFLGRVYPAGNNPCPLSQIVPLTTSKSTLDAAIDALTVSGSTAGHIGIAWGWYMVSPNFGYLWPEESRPAAYETEKLLKVVVIMTDGSFNTPYCNGVIAKDATSGSGSASDHINCNAPNGSSFNQARNLCDAMKAQDIVVYTVGFQVPLAGQDVMNYCASDPTYAYNADDGEELNNAFISIANSINSLYISQ